MYYVCMYYISLMASVHYVQELVDLNERHLTEERLIRFAEQRKPVKRMGKMGDDLVHTEL